MQNRSGTIALNANKFVKNSSLIEACKKTRDEQLVNGKIITAREFAMIKKSHPKNINISIKNFLKLLNIVMFSFLIINVYGQALSLS